VQVCLALSGLALQLPSWSNAVQSLIDKFGRNPTTVPVLLQFLTVFPEELASNSKIPVTVSLVVGLRTALIASTPQDEEFRQRSSILLSDNSKKLLELLSMYNQASGGWLIFVSQDNDTIDYQASRTLSRPKSSTACVAG
jgi:transportin-3